MERRRTHGEQTMENGSVSQDSELEKSSAQPATSADTIYRELISDIESPLRQIYLETGQADCIRPDTFNERSTVTNIAITN